MYLRNCLTYKDWRNFSFRRNACLGQLTMARASMKNMINSNLVSDSDKEVLQEILSKLTTIIETWDKHYTMKLKKETTTKREI